MVAEEYIVRVSQRHETADAGSIPRMLPNFAHLVWRLESRRGPQQQGIHESKYACIHADTQGEGDYNPGSRAGMLAQHARAEP